MPLAEIEKAFVKCLLQPDAKDEGFLSHLLPLASLSEEKQLFIYRSNINGAHQKVLAQVYPACFNILGEGYFNQLCRAYRSQYPSTGADLNYYGEHFPFFISEQFSLRQELTDFEYLADLACLEWHWHHSFYSKDNDLFDFDALMSINPELHDRLVFRLANSFSLHSTPYPVLDIWQANKNDEVRQQEFIMPESKHYFCISRAEFVPVVDVISRYDFLLLKSIMSGASLINLSAIENREDGIFQKQLLYFIEKKWITGFFVQDQANII